MERLPPPTIIAPAGEPASAEYRLYVPDNVGDKVAAVWSRGRDATIAGYRTEKAVRPTRIAQGEDSVYYLWSLLNSDPELESHGEVLLAAAGSITHLGWGVDMVASCASVISSEDVAKLRGERWRPTGDASTNRLRVPIKGTFDELIGKHRAFLERVRPDGFHPVPALSTFQSVSYSRSTDTPARRFAAFSLLKPDASGFRPFATVERSVTVAAMMRHAASSEMVARALGWTSEKVARFVLGHGEAPGRPHAPVDGPRLAFIPIPSIEPRGAQRAEVVGAIRRVLVTVFGGSADADLQRLARLLAGAELVAEGGSTAEALLSRIPSSDRVLRRYVDASPAWATVTPVILPGYDDPRKLRKRLFATEGAGASSSDGMGQEEVFAKLDRRADFLLRKAIRQAGFSEERARMAEIDWRGVGYWPGTDLAARYSYPQKLRRFRRVHVRITWRDSSGKPLALPGPVCIGGGRFHGLGLFAAENRGA
jgi:CRISPR-associated protein Csb2